MFPMAHRKGTVKLKWQESLNRDIIQCLDKTNYEIKHFK